MGWNKSGLRRLIPELTWQCSPQVERIVTSWGPGSRVLDIGAGGRRIAPYVITVDFVDSGDTDVVADATATPFREESVDLLVATGLLEHLEDEVAFLEEARRIVRRGGDIYIEIPFLQQYHDDPIDCRRLTLPGLERLLRRHGFEPETSGVHIGPTVTLITLFANYCQIMFEGPTLAHRIVSNGVYAVLATLLFPFRYLDAFMGKKKSAYQLAFGVYCAAKRL